MDLRSTATPCKPLLTLAQNYWNRRQKTFTYAQHDNAWITTADILKSYTEDMIQRWNEEIDALLVYVSLESQFPSCLRNDH